MCKMYRRDLRKNSSLKAFGECSLIYGENERNKEMEKINWKKINSLKECYQ